MALVGNILLGTGAAPVMSSIASAYAESAASSRIPWSALEYSGQTITAISGSAIGGQGGGGGGVTPEDVSAIASSYANDKLDKTASSTFAPSGDYAYASSLSSYLPGSASSNFAPSGDYAYNSSLTGYQDRSSISAWTGDMSSISSKLDQIAFTSYSSTVNNNITSIENNITAISSVVSGKADASAVHTYTGIDPVVVDNTADTISLNATSMHFDSTMTAYMSGDSGFVGVNTAQFQPSGNYQTAGNYMSATESSAFYPMTGNPSSFIQSSDMAGYASTAYVQSSVSGKLDKTAQVVTACSSFNGFVKTINGKEISAYRSNLAYSADLAQKAGSGYVGNDTYVPFSAFAMDSSLSSKLDATAAYAPTFGYDADKISSIDGSALAGGGGGMTYTSPSGTIAVDNVNGTLESWDSSMRVDEHITAASFFAGTAQQLYSSNNVGQWSSVWTGGTLPGDVATFSAAFPMEVPNDGYNVRAFGIKEGGGTAQLAEFIIPREVFVPYSGSATASASINEAYSSIYMLVSGPYGVPSTGQYQESISGITNVERPAQTASSTSIYRQILDDATWQSLTAWAVAQGWTP